MVWSQNPGAESLAIGATSQSVAANNTDFVSDEVEEFQDDTTHQPLIKLLKWKLSTSKILKLNCENGFLVDYQSKVMNFQATDPIPYTLEMTSLPI